MGQQLRSLTDWRPVVCHEAVFTAPECFRILGYVTETKAGGAAGKLDRAVRHSEIQALHPSEENRWLFEKLAAQINGVNQAHFRFELAGFTEPLQLTCYETGHFYDWHLDIGNNRNSIRKLSFILQLADSGDYEGGDVEIQGGSQPVALPRSLGAMALFPSYVLHRVREVTQGRRTSLVGWIGGHHFR